MHPAASVILFTTSTGFGYGLLIWLGFSLNIADSTVYTTSSLLTIIGTALALITFGLLSSTWHLGHPERAWRAMSQWRTSWLSREGVFAILVYPPALLMAYFAYCENTTALSYISILTAILSLITVYCTAMIYASLKTIPAWHNCWTISGYLMYSLATGGVLFYFLSTLFTIDKVFFSELSLLFCTLFASLILACINKLLYYHHISQNSDKYTKEMAIGLKGNITPLDPPHSSANYLMKEMGFVIAREKVAVLKPISLIASYILPVLFIHFLFGATLSPIILSTLALISCTVGIIAERYLFFAEAKHVVTLYYR